MNNTCVRNPIDSKQKIILFLPLIAIEIYLLVTLVLYQFGPYPWPTKNPNLFWSLIAAYHLAFILGYFACMKMKYCSRETINMDNTMSIITKCCLVVNLPILLLTITRRFGLPRIVNITELFERVMHGLRSPAEVYHYQFSQEFVDFGGKGLTLFLLATSLIAFAAIPLGLIYFKKLSTTFRSILLVNLILEVSKWIGTGTNKGIFDLVITAVVLFALAMMSHLYINKIDRKKVIIATSVLVVGITIFLLFFNKAIGSRLSGDAWLEYPVGGIFPTRDCALFKILPAVLQKPIALLALYVTQGYYAFSLATTIPWIPMFGLGGSMFLQEYIDKYIFNISQFTYSDRLIQFGWDPRVNWHSLYVWIGNDLSLYGVILFMLVFGFVFAYFYRVSLIDQNALAKLIFVFLTIMALFIPANNQVLGFLFPCIEFIACVLCYVIFCKTQPLKK